MNFRKCHNRRSNKPFETGRVNTENLFTDTQAVLKIFNIKQHI